MRSLKALHTVLFVLSLGTMNCGNGPATPDEVLEPTVVGYEQFYGTFGPATYFLFGFDETEGAVPILRELLDSGITVRRAWFPHGDGGCMMPLLSQMVVELIEPDPRILDHGFTTDHDELAPGVCIPTWFQYSFRTHGAAPLL